MTCPICGENTIGDGYSTVIHCPNAEIEDHWYSEPDGQPVYCKESPDPSVEDVQSKHNNTLIK